MHEYCRNPDPNKLGESQLKHPKWNPNYWWTPRPPPPAGTILSNNRCLRDHLLPDWVGAAESRGKIFWWLETNKYMLWGESMQKKIHLCDYLLYYTLTSVTGVGRWESGMLAQNTHLHILMHNLMYLTSNLLIHTYICNRTLNRDITPFIKK